MSTFLSDGGNGGKSSTGGNVSSLKRKDSYEKFKKTGL
jgi:hypothetical protein